MISIELVIQEKACDMIRFLESSYLNITDPAGARGNECLGTKPSVVEAETKSDSKGSRERSEPCS